MKQKTRYVILGLLSEEDLSGYQIQKLIQLRFRFFWNESYGQIYPMLKSMVEEGWIAVASSSGQRRQIRYRITSQGVDALKAWLLESPEKESMRLELLLKIYFGNLAHPEILNEHVKDFMLEHQQELSILEQFKQELLPIQSFANHKQILQVIDFGIQTNQAYVSWCENYLEGAQNEKD